MTFILTLFLGFSYLTFVFLNATPLDLGTVAGDLWDKAPTFAVLIGVIYYMLKAQDKNKDFYDGLLAQSQLFYKTLREEDKKEAAAEKQELLAAFEKIEEREKEGQKLHQERMEFLMTANKETINSILESQNKKDEKYYALKVRLLDTIATKDSELIAAYRQNIASTEKLGEMLKLFSEIQAEFTGKITESIHSKFEQIFQVLRGVKSS